MTMELEFERETMTYYETAASVTLCQEETLESIVPDACPDILRIVDVCGQGMLTGTQARDGVASVSGLVPVPGCAAPRPGPSTPGRCSFGWTWRWMSPPASRWTAPCAGGF